jgi:hypothetical protein
MSKVSSAKKIGRPKVDSEAVNVRMSRDMLAELDAFIAKQPKPVSRPEAIRAFVAAGLHLMGGE